MSIIVNDPGFQEGQIIPIHTPYLIEMSRDETGVFKVIEVSPQIYQYAVWGYIFLQCLITGSLLMSGLLSLRALTSFASVGGTITALQIIHLFLSFKSVSAEEYGGITFFGRPVKLVSSGLIFVPWLILNIEYQSNIPIQIQCPADPEKVFKGGDKNYFALTETEREKFMLPIRALTGGPKPGSDTTNILDTQLTIEVMFIVRFAIDNFWVFKVNIGSLKEAARQLRDAGEATLIKEIAQRTPREVVEQIGDIADALREKLEKTTDAWGISIIETSIPSPDLSHDVNTELQNIFLSKARATQLIIDTEAQAKATERSALATKKKLELEGEGSAAAKLAELKAMAAGHKELEVDGNAVIDLEKARAIAGGKATIILDGTNNGNITGFGARLAAGTEAIKEKE